MEKDWFISQFVSNLSIAQTAESVWKSSMQFYLSGGTNVVYLFEHIIDLSMVHFLICILSVKSFFQRILQV